MAIRAGWRLSVLGMLAVLAACDSGSTPITLRDSTSEATVASGQTLRIEKQENSSIGYHWTLADAGNAQVVKPTEDHVEQPLNAAPGSYSTHVWTFQAVAAGQTQLRYTFQARPGLNMSIPGPEVYTVTVR